MVPLRGVGVAAKGLPARKWLWMPAPVRSGRRHPPRVTWFWLVSAYFTCPGRGRLASRFARRRSSSRHLPPADPVPAPGASSGSRGDGGHRLADGEPIDRSARHAGRGCGRGFSCWRPPPRYPREASTGSTARFDLTCVTSRRHAWLPHRTPRISVTGGTHRRLAHVPADVQADPERGEPRQSPRRSTSPPGATFATDQTINPDARRHRDARGTDCTLELRWTCPSRSSGTRSTGTNTVGAVTVTPACPHVDPDATLSRAPGRRHRWPSSAGVCRSPCAYPRRTAWRMPR